MLQKSTTRKNSKVSAVCIASSKELNANSNLGLTSTRSSRMKKRSRLRWMGVRYSITNQGERSTFLDQDRCFNPLCFWHWVFLARFDFGVVFATLIAPPPSPLIAPTLIAPTREQLGVCISPTSLAATEG